MLVDLDGFKEVNTLHGFPPATPSSETARILERCVRTGDMVARLGGDEFAVLARGRRRRHARSRRACSRRCEGCSGADLPGSSSRPASGWALHPDDAGTIDDLIAAADFCLRGAKLTGKDRRSAAVEWAGVA